MFLSIIGFAISVSALIIAYWVMSIIGFIRAIAKRRKEPGEFKGLEFAIKVVNLIISTVLMAMLVFIAISVIRMLYDPVPFM